ncbi:phage tail length tape measure family protein [Yoonia sp. R2-816]|uniref:phage tail length tape measure family protein n=1 Tax=Yoonia sp. R2-816 TaxID=3342638 RepID=UPI00372B9AAE
MSDFRVGLRIEGESASAERALNNVDQGLDRAGRSAREMGAANRRAGNDTRRMGQDAEAAARDTRRLRQSEEQAAAAARALAQANARAAASSRGLGGANRAAAGQLGNLTAQFNDLGVMLAAGQSPLLLALQQGTQITQVIGPMGAAGAARALGGAFLGMLNPLSLLTLGVIGGGAALFQYAQSALAARNDVVDLEEVIDSLDDAMSNLQSTGNASRISAADLREEYGRYARQAREILVIERGIAAAVAQGALVEATGGVAAALGDISQVTSTEVTAMLTALTDLEEGYDDALDFLYNPGRSDPGANPVIANLAEQLGTSAEEALVKLGAFRNDLIQLQQQLDVGPAAADRMADALARMGTAGSFQDKARAANDLAIEIHDATDGLKDADDATRDLYQQLLEVVKAGLQFKQLSMEDGILPALQAAKELAAELNVSYLTAAQLSGLEDRVSGPDAAIADLQNQGLIGGVLSGVVSTTRTGPGTQRTRSPRGGASAAERERKAVTDLIATLEQELAIQRELDPVQQEMIRHRETLGAASDAEREKIEELIATREREAVAMELARENLAEWKDITNGILDDLIQSGGDLESVFENVMGLLLQMIQQAALLGTGPLASVFGTAGGNGAVDAFVQALAGGAGVPARAEGGRIYGPGGGTSDDVLMWGSSGETMMNARATRRYGPLLDAMNGDAVVPGFARGGAIGGNPAPQHMFGGVSISIENRGSTPIRGEIEEQPDGSGGRKFALVLADEVGAALTTKGGGARRTLQQTYGVRQRGSRR